VFHLPPSLAEMVDQHQRVELGVFDDQGPKSRAFQRGGG
jgi:hypothetical protein